MPAKKSRTARTRTAPKRRSACPVACSLDLLGDRWTLLIVRDLFRGLTRYGEFAAGPEGIPTNILSERLARLETEGLIRSEPYQTNPPRYAYTLTAKGADLKPVIGALASWAMRQMPGTHPDKELAAALKQ